MHVHSFRLVFALAVLALLPTSILTYSGTLTAPSGHNEQSVRDGVYSRPQAERGRVLFDSQCRVCHDVSRFVGEDYVATWEGQTLRDLNLYVSTAMPPDMHEPFGDFLAYSELVAYILRSNDFPPGEVDLSANLDRLGLISIDPMQ